MKIQTFSIVAGSEACNARCPFCVSKMTVPHGIDLKEPEVNMRNFGKACRLAKMSGVTTAMITSKGEPTLFPEQVTRYMEALRPFEFPFIELQSNGIVLLQKRDRYKTYLDHWYECGLSTVAVSIVHFDPEKNREIYVPHMKSYIDLPELVRLLHGHGFSVRLTAVMVNGYIDDVETMEGLIRFATEHDVEQLTVRPVNRPGSTRNDEVSRWIGDNYLPENKLQSIMEWLQEKGTHLMTLQHGAIVYDVDGQNVCLTDSLSIDSGGEDIRQLIFFPDGHLRYDWQYKGAILL